MKAITIFQPHATLIADRRKPYETRHWHPPLSLIGQRIAIHAGRSVAERGAAGGFGYLWDDLPLGAVVATALIVAAHHIGPLVQNGTRAVSWHDSLRRDEDPDYTYRGTTGSFPVDPFGDYSLGRWAWRLIDVHTLVEPIAARGAQGFWDWSPPDDLARLLDRTIGDTGQHGNELRRESARRRVATP